MVVHRRCSWLGTLLVAASAMAFGTGAGCRSATAPDEHLAGTWSGQTAQGGTISFVIGSGDRLTTLDFAGTVSCAGGGTAPFTFHDPTLTLVTMETGFNFSGTRDQISYTITATFSGDVSATGTLSGTLISVPAGCPVTFQTTWTARKG